MKRKTAKEILLESFLELAQTRSIDKITIRDITGNCGYSPATFYRQVRDKYDLIAWDYASHEGDIMRQIMQDGSGLRQALHSPLFTALQAQGLLDDDHAGGCVLYEKRDQVEKLMKR